VTKRVIALVLFGLTQRASAVECAAPSSWPLWKAYSAHFISEDGRVVDHTSGSITTSEGQSYALFFALVENDRPLFRRLLKWTADNLAEGHLEARLPAYKWGRRDDGVWTVLDDNSASDADLWIGFVLLEAGRLWDAADLTRTGRALLRQIVAREMVSLPRLGTMLLPAPHGFVHGRLWRLNPSYLPPQLIRGLVTHGVPGPWGALRANMLRMITARARHGFIDDWVAYRPSSGFAADPIKGAIGSYDAIRVYLWQGLLDPADQDRARLGRLLAGPYDFWRQRGQVPERIDTRRPGADAPPGPVGFLAVLLPRLAATGNHAELARLNEQIETARAGTLYGSPPTYYDQNLLLFAQGFVEKRYRFDPQGRLVPAWQEHCREGSSPDGVDRLSR
jgi:endo-1,4-beta-D-glucanase Y